MTAMRVTTVTSPGSLWHFYPSYGYHIMHNTVSIIAEHNSRTTQCATKNASSKIQCYSTHKRQANNKQFSVTKSSLWHSPSSVQTPWHSPRNVKFLDISRFSDKWPPPVPWMLPREHKKRKQCTPVSTQNAVLNNKTCIGWDKKMKQCSTIK